MHYEAAGSTTAKPDSLLTVEEVARWLCVSPAWVRAHSNGNRRPHLRCVKLGKSVRFRREAIEHFLLECERLAGAVA